MLREAAEIRDQYKREKDPDTRQRLEKRYQEIDTELECLKVSSQVKPESEPTEVSTNVVPVRKNRQIFLLAIVILLIGFLYYAFVYSPFQSTMDSVIRDDPRNYGIVMKVNYGGGAVFGRSSLNIDLKSVQNSSPLDVFRVLLQFAEKVKFEHFVDVNLLCGGRRKFTLRGSYFNTLGEEYEWQNPVYTIQTFPEHVLDSRTGLPVFGTWEGGLLAVKIRQMEDFTQFHQEWWVKDLSH